MRKELVVALWQEFPIIFRPDGDGVRLTPAVGDGWYDIVRDMCMGLEEIAARPGYNVCECGHHHDDHVAGECHHAFVIDTPGCMCREFRDDRLRIITIKEKFAEMRCYTNRYLGADIIKNAENSSHYVCEECGNQGTAGPISPKRGWIKTLCASCRIALSKSFE